MGVQRKHISNISRRKFGQPSGRNSRKAARNYKIELLQYEQRCRKYMSDKLKYKPYQLVCKQVKINGKCCTKFIVRRIPIVKLFNYKIIRLGDNLKFTLHKENVSGYRIINIDTLKDHVVDITTHVCLCPDAQALAYKGQDPVALATEKCRQGLFSIIVARCRGCQQLFHISNSFKQANTNHYDINVRAVWGTVTSGGGPSQLNELMGTMNMPQMDKKLFSKIETDIGRWWGDVLKEEMAKAGKEERSKAIERNDFHQGVPSITVVCDGGWSKRTHKHSYNALGGVGVIFGQVTKKLLYIGVRNKQCVLCEKAEKSNATADHHECFRNWYASSQSMESDIILAGFLESESVHGVRYMRVIADGDSSVYSKLMENIPVWGPHIKKFECANHTCKCIRSNLERLVQEKSYYKGKGKLTGKNIVRITTAVRCAIRMRSKNMNIKLLKHDIRNSIFHVLGFHEKCSDFCQKKTTKTDDDNNDDKDDDDITNDDNSMDNIFNSQCDFWSIASEKEMNNCRQAGRNKVSLKEIQDIIRDVSVILGRVAERAERLCGNYTTNLAESWMSIRAKFDGGKMVNRCGRGSWTTRCYGGALRKNIGPAWSPSVFQSVTGVPAGSFFYNSGRCQVMMRKHCEKYAKTDQAKTVRRKRKLRCLQENSNKKARMDYGSPLDDTPDISEEKLEQSCNSFYDQHIVKTGSDIRSIEQCTVAQSQCDLWKKERRMRLTSSNFGKVICRKPTNISPCLVKTLLYSSFQGNINTIRGLAQEENTVIEYKNKNENVEVRKTGLVICEKYPFLAASTDGIVTDGNNNEGLIEIKNLLQNNKNMIKEAVKTVPNFCLKEAGKGLQLKRNHHIYYQIQGQLNIMNKPWCDFILRRSNPHDIYIERIFVDKALWSSMVMKLKAFYFKFLLPEIASPRYATASGIRKPTSPWFSPPLDCPSTSKPCNRKPCNRKNKQPTCTKLSKQIPTTSRVDSSNQISPTLEELPTGKTKRKCEVVNKLTSSKLSLSSAVVSANQLSSPVQSSSKETYLSDQTASHSVSPKKDLNQKQRRSKRGKKVPSRLLTFVGRKIEHMWIINEEKQEKKWYLGTILRVIKGSDGCQNAVYEVQYEGEATTCEIDNLQHDLNEGSLKFVD